MELTSTPSFAAGECAWTSGASSGIGRAVAHCLARAGVEVFLTARREELLREVARSIGAEGGKAHALAADVTDPVSMETAMGEIVRCAGRLDIVVPCAGAELLCPFHLVSTNDWQRLMEVNVIAAFGMVRLAMPLLRASGKRPDGNMGRVVFVSSSAATRGWAGQSAYSASKAALLGGVGALAVEFGPSRVRVNAVVPGIVWTDMTERLYAKIPVDRRAAITAAHPLGLGSPDDVARAITFLASNEARWITGATLRVDGGLGCA